MQSLFEVHVLVFGQFVVGDGFVYQSSRRGHVLGRARGGKALHNLLKLSSSFERDSVRFPRESSASIFYACSAYLGTHSDASFASARATAARMASGLYLSFMEAPLIPEAES